jgi:hypothetical protein
MKKILIYFSAIILLITIGGIFSNPILLFFEKYKVFSNHYVLNLSDALYCIILFLPFLISNSLGAILAGILISIIIYEEKIIRIGCMFLIFGSTPFVLISSLNEKASLIISKLVISGIFIFVFGCIGGILGRYIRRAIGETHWGT